jgi:hypothetical protein
MKKMLLITKLLISTICFSQVQYGNGNVAVTGNITTQNLNPNTGVPTVGSFVELSLANQSTATIFVSGSYTGVLSIQFTINGGANWITVTTANALLKKDVGLPVATIASGNTGAWIADVAGLTNIRITALAAVTGNATITIKAVQSAQQVGLNQPLPAGGNIIGTVNINGTAIVNATPVTYATNGTTTTFLNSLATTNSTLVKSTGGVIYSVCVNNASATTKYLRLFNLATLPTAGTSTPSTVITIPASTSREIQFPVGLKYVTGIGFIITNAAPYLDATAVAAGDVQVTINYQ